MTNEPKEQRVYSARQRTEEAGTGNPAAERIAADLRRDLTARYGEPLTETVNPETKARKVVAFNSSWWAAFLAATRQILWEADEQRGYKFSQAAGIWVRASESDLLAEVASLLRDAAALDQLGGVEKFAKGNHASEILLFWRAAEHAGKTGVFAKDAHGENRAIAFQNGTLRIRGRDPFTFEPRHRPKDYLRNVIPVRYDPKADCPRTIEQLLRPALPPETCEDDMRLLFAWLGMAVLGANLPQVILLLDGASNSGKTTCAKLAARLVGRQNVGEVRTKWLNERFELTGLVGKSLLLGADVGPKFLLEEGAKRLKSLTGGEFLEAEAKSGNERIPVEGIFNIVLTANSELRLRLEGDDDAWRRRLLVIHFVRAVEQSSRIPDFDKQLVDLEGPGIVNRALNELQEYLTTNQLPVTKAQLARTDELLERSDALAEFCRSRIERAAGCSLAQARIRKAYFDYCLARKWQLLTDTEINKRLTEILRELFAVVESNSVRHEESGVTTKDTKGYRGIRWRDE